MSNIIIINCETGEFSERDFTQDEIDQREAEIQALAEQLELEKTIPTQGEQEQADFEIRGINLLIEMGLL